MILGLTDLSYKMDQKVYGKLHLLEVVSMISSKLGKSIFKTTKTRALMSITVARFLKLTFNEEKLTVGNVINIFGALVPSNYVYEEIAKVDGALDLLKSLFLADETFNSERLQEEFTDFVSDDSISYGDSEKQFCSGLCAFFTMANGYNAEKLVAKFTENSTSRFYMVILAVSTIPKFNFSLQFKHHIVKVCSFKLRNAKAFDQADLLCRMIANTVQNGQKYPELELLAFNQNQMTDNSNLDLWLYISIKLINTLYGNKSITPSPELVEKHSKYVYYNITVTSKYDAVAIQIFNKSKYQLLLHLLKLDGNHDKFLDYCVEQLGICSFENLEFVFDSLIFLVSSLKFTVPNIDLVSEAIKVSIKRFEESWKISNSWFTMISKFTEFAYSPPVLAQLPISIISTTTILLKWSETRMGIINRVSKCLSAYWISVKDSECLLPWIPTMIDLCYYGPARQSLDIEVRMETLVLHKLSNVDNTDERYETCLWDFNCQDYVVRVDVNHYFMGLSTSSFTWELIKAILARLESKLLKRKNYVNSFNQKISMRLGMSLQVLIGVAPEKNKSELLAGLFRALTYEKVVESMAWIEWGIARLVLGNLRDLQSQFFAFFKECNKVSHCAHSMVLICLQLIPLIEDPVLKSDFTIEAILLSLSWSGNKLYTIRVLTQYLIFKHYFSHPRLENLAYFLDHIKQNQDSQKAFEKIKLYHFFNDFNPLMVSAEFIFKGFLAMMEYSTEERISSLAFVKVCMESGCGCGFDLGYATRKESAALLSRSVRPRIADTNESPQPLDSSSSIDNIFNTSTKSGSDTNPERPHQRKIVSWQNFMLTDIELSGFRNLEVVRPRLQLQIIASLITKPVNLGGLTRTCETFSCGLLCMDTLDVAKDPSFLSTCVSAGSCNIAHFRKMVPNERS